MTESVKRLYRSRIDKRLAGVCGGIARYFEIDPVIVRLIWVFASLMAGGGIILYIIAWIVIPLEPQTSGF